jgi:23S rRNA-/tRNA-specific pseudouridylate synthase
MSNISLFEKNILYEDNHLIIVNKQPGELTQSDKTKDATLGDKVKDYLKKKIQQTRKCIPWNYSQIR